MNLFIFFSIFFFNYVARIFEFYYKHHSFFFLDLDNFENEIMGILNFFELILLSSA